jgi:hypothetical protein
LIVGVMGVGKASVLWAIIAGLVPFIRSGLVNRWVIDPKRWRRTRPRPTPLCPFSRTATPPLMAATRNHWPGWW